MLVLGRREQQQVVIDLTAYGLGFINVSVEKIKPTGGPTDNRPMVRLGFKADRRIKINRLEVLQRDRSDDAKVHLPTH